MESFVFGPTFEEDLDLGAGAIADVTLPDGSHGTLTQINLHSFVHKVVAPTYGASVPVDASLGDHFIVSATNGSAFTIVSPTNPKSAGQEIRIRVKNTSGGGLGTITWDSLYKMAAFTAPATGYSRSIAFQYDGAAWIEINRTTADIPN